MKPKNYEPQRHAQSSAVAKTSIPDPLKNLVNSPPPASVKQSTTSGLLSICLGDLMLEISINFCCGTSYSFSINMLTECNI